MKTIADGRAWCAVPGAALLVAAGCAGTPSAGAEVPEAAPDDEEADSPAALAPGEPFDDALAPDDPSGLERGRFRVYELEASAGQRLRITMRSGDFDAFVSVARDLGGITEVVAVDDDSGGGVGGTDARLDFVAPQEGTYLVIAQAVYPDQRGLGGYTIDVQERPEPVRLEPVPIALGQSVRGEIGAASMVMETIPGQTARFVPYVLVGSAGQAVTLTLEAEGFAGAVLVERGTEGLDDFDSRSLVGAEMGEGVIRVRADLPEEGTYLVRVLAMTDGAAAFTLRAQEHEPAPAPEPVAIALGSSEEGSLDESAPQTEDGRPFADWMVETNACEHLEITMRSEDFDTLVEFGRRDGDRFELIDGNDDGPGMGTDSRLSVTAKEPGAYIIRVQALEPGGSGDYGLSVARDGVLRCR